MSQGSPLAQLVDTTVSVITADGRNIVGVLRGLDQSTNLILDKSHERVYSTKELKLQPALQKGVEQLVLGLYVIRGDNIAIVGELDEGLDQELDLNAMRAAPLRAVGHGG